MGKKFTHGKCLNAYAGEQHRTPTKSKSNAIFKAIALQLAAVVTRPAVQVLHKMELTTTTTLAFGLMCSWPVSAVEFELKPALIISKPLPHNTKINHQHDGLGLELTPPQGCCTTKIVAITFLPDWLESADSSDFPPDIDINIDSKWCEEQGYSLSCPDGMSKILNKDCPRDHNYGTCSIEQYCKDNGYIETSVTCRAKGGNYFVDTSQKCPNGQNFYKRCLINNQQACKDAGYVNSCSSGRMYLNLNKCPYDSSYGRCCSGAASSGCPSGYKVDCAGMTSGTDACGYPCKQCCAYTTTAASCHNKCMYTGSESCNINGITYYSGCGLSKCGAYESCSNGSCDCRPGYQEWCTPPETDCIKLGYIDDNILTGLNSIILECPFDYCPNGLTGGCTSKFLNVRRECPSSYKYGMVQCSSLPYTLGTNNDCCGSMCTGCKCAPEYSWDGSACVRPTGPSLSGMNQCCDDLFGKCGNVNTCLSNGKGLCSSIFPSLCYKLLNNFGARGTQPRFMGCAANGEATVGCEFYY